MDLDSTDLPLNKWRHAQIDIQRHAIIDSVYSQMTKGRVGGMEHDMIDQQNNKNCKSL